MILLNKLKLNQDQDVPQGSGAWTISNYTNRDNTISNRLQLNFLRTYC